MHTNIIFLFFLVRVSFASVELNLNNNSTGIDGALDESSSDGENNFCPLFRDSDMDDCSKVQQLMTPFYPELAENCNSQQSLWILEQMAKCCEEEDFCSQKDLLKFFQKSLICGRN